MRFGLLELRRNAGRFAAVAGAVGFIVFLALILAGLSDGLYLGTTGAFRTSQADVFAFSDGSDFELTSSQVSQDLAQRAVETDGVRAVGRLSRFNTTATSDGEDIQLTLVGADAVTMPVEIEDGRRPEDASNEVLIDDQTRRQGVDIGDTIAITDGADLEVVGIAADAGFGTVTAWIDHDSYDAVIVATRPELAGLVGTSQSLGLELTDPTDAIEVDGLVIATPQEAIDALPAASQQKTTLNGIVYTTFAVAAIVVGLFFALVTLEKRSQFAVLKAIGMPNRVLVAALFTQAVVSSLAGFLIGFALARLAALVIPPSVPALFLLGTAGTVAIATLVMGAIGAIFSFRRIINIDPASALGGAL